MNTPSTRQSLQIPTMHTPPITPAATRSQDMSGIAAKEQSLPQLSDVNQDLAFVTPQVSPPSSSPVAHSVEESLMGTNQENTISISTVAVEKNLSTCLFSVGSEDESLLSSRESSSVGKPAASAYCRPFAPTGDVNDPYAAGKRIPQCQNLANLDSRFRFTALNSKSRMGLVQFSASDSHRPKRYSADQNGVVKRSFRGTRDHTSQSSEENNSHKFQRQGSIADLKRLLKLGGCGKSKQSISSIASLYETKFLNRAVAPSKHKNHQQFPFSDDHALHSKYGKLGKVLGAGAGGSVRLMKRSSDGKTFAVKEFRARHSCESEKDYTKKVTAEFCIGSILHHGNIIETLDIVCEKDKWYEVMEYAPYDLFAIVMTGKMSKDEISCSFLQILNAVTYLHSMGLAHRDLKLDNVVVNEHGIMKIIDFGSASVFKYPFESGITKASGTFIVKYTIYYLLRLSKLGIVGSDPYLAPEVYDERKYDPQPADIWSLAIIFCCMSLCRFPWKLPRMTDNSFKLFASAPSPAAEQSVQLDEQMASNQTSHYDSSAKNITPNSDVSRNLPGICDRDTGSNIQNIIMSEKKPEVIKGPWRLLRLLPRESRKIIGRMLEIDPKKRAPMSEIIEDPWVSGTAICTRESNGQVIHAAGHTHTLEPPTPPVKKQQTGTQAKFRAKLR